ncbi:hypothetical protein [Bradyrhizobium sp. CCBAU 25338]|uniref:hypothetical protein n=1 Tax=Bradyrhizobium sp. CCBAU 25338 TaxID=1641877 RepID=UPI0023036562|nr:hypothetical protein [Bradyrhizobium sp. CCBAU 25338]
MERGLRLHTQPKHKNLYSWAINEIDEQGRKIGEDQIPWAWSLYFVATSCSLGDSIDLKTKYASQDRELEIPEIAEDQRIAVTLRPQGEDSLRGTQFSMFGTDRAIKSFQLDIRQLTDPAAQESCSAWGCVSYTSEIDFRNETVDDCVVFYLRVKPETFARYAAKVSAGSVDEVGFRVGGVTGFYSEWSPSISTRRVKVLTRGDEHKVELPRGVDFDPPRLGYVGDAALHINRRLEFAKRAPRSEADEETVSTVRVTPETQAVAAKPELQTLKVLKSMRRAAWVVVCLLALIFIATLSRR